MPRPTLGLIWAQSINGVIGAQGDIPWSLPEDLHHFQQVTAGATVVMGRRTWESLPPFSRPLQGRRNIVVTTAAGYDAAGAETAPSVDQALELAAGDRAVWVIGGERVYEETIDRADILEVTLLRGEFEGDTWAPAIGYEWDLEHEGPWQIRRDDPNLDHRFFTYTRAAQG